MSALPESVAMNDADKSKAGGEVRADPLVGDAPAMILIVGMVKRMRWSAVAERIQWVCIRVGFCRRYGRIMCKEAGRMVRHGGASGEIIGRRWVQR